MTNEHGETELPDTPIPSCYFKKPDNVDYWTVINPTTGNGIVMTRIGKYSHQVVKVLKPDEMDQAMGPIIQGIARL